MIGCTVETRVGITAEAHFALAMRNVHHNDPDGCCSPATETTDGGLKPENREYFVPGHAGHGISVRRPQPEVTCLGAAVNWTAGDGI